MSETAASPRIFAKGYLPPDMTRHNSNVAETVNVLKWPLGGPENFSVSRACWAINRIKSGMSAGAAWATFAPWEKQWLDAVAQVQYKAMGDQVSGQDGGFLAPEYWSSDFIGLLRSFTAIDQLPVRRYNVPFRVDHLPRVIGDIAISYQTESGAIARTQYKFGQLTYTPRKAAATILVQNELMRDAPTTVDQILRNEGALAIAADRDTQIFMGDGTAGKPIGLVNNPQVAKYYTPTTATVNLGTVAAHGTPSFFHLSQLRSKVTNLNGSTNVTAGQAQCNGIVIHSRFEQTVHSQAAGATGWTDAQGRPLWMAGLNGAGSPNPDGGKGSLMGLNWALTNVLPVNSTDGGGTASSYAIAGWWDRFILWECLALGFDATPFGQGFASDQTEVRIMHRWDAGPAAAEAFAVLAGVDQ